MAGAFIGLNYTTNNLFGKGESLTLQFQIGQYQRNETLSFTQPYLFDRPLQFGWSVYHSSYNYNQAALTQIQLNQTVTLPQSYQALLQNFTQTSTGFYHVADLPDQALLQARRHHLQLRRFVGYRPIARPRQTTFESLAFRGISGPNSLNGIITSKIVPNFSYNRIDNPARPHSGQSFYVATEVAGLGGNVKYFKPVAEYKRFIPVNKGRNTFGFRVLGSWISGYGGQVAPPFDRFYMGGDTDIRGFDIRAISPVSFFPTVVTVPLQNPDGSNVPLNPANPAPGYLEHHHPGRTDHLSRWRHQHRQQPGVPGADRRTGDDCCLSWTRGWISSPTSRNCALPGRRSQPFRTRSSAVRS